MENKTLRIFLRKKKSFNKQIFYFIFSDKHTLFYILLCPSKTFYF